MKKYLGVSLVAMLAVAPLAANAAGANPTAATTSSEPYLGVAISDTEKEQIASVGFVKGAYNAAIGAVNAVDAKVTAATSTANNAANKDLGNISSAGQTVIDNRAKAVASSGTFTASTGTNISATTIGAAINEVAADYIAADTALNTAISGKQAQLKNNAGTPANISSSVLTSVRAAASASDTSLVTEKAVRTAIDKVATTANNALTSADIATGSANGTIKVKGSDVAVKGLGTAAYTASTAYATSAQGTKADNAANSALSNITTAGQTVIDNRAKAVAATGSYDASASYADSTIGKAIKDAAAAAAAAQSTANGALVKADIATGSANGTISVKGTDVTVKGLGTAAYTASTAYDAAGAANTAKTNIESKLAAGSTGYDINAKTLKVNGTAVATTTQVSAKQDQLKAGTSNVSSSVQTTVRAAASAVDTALVSEKAVRSAIDTAVSGLISSNTVSSTYAKKTGVTATISASTGSASICKEWGAACTGTNLGTATVTLSGATYTE